MESAGPKKFAGYNLYYSWRYRINTYFFDQWLKAVWLINDDNFWNFYQIWSDSIGIIYEEDDLLEIRFNLASCVVNGKVYGDTTGLTDIAAGNVLGDFRLEQNYPNPFNQSVII